MAQKKQVTKSRSNKRLIASGAAQSKSGRRKGPSVSASVKTSRGRSVSLGDVLEFYKPIKKPVTLRLDADVLAWFRRDGRRYQTRINSALRRVMEREMKDSE